MVANCGVMENEILIFIYLEGSTGKANSEERPSRNSILVDVGQND
jgi:hypothetical protein